MLRSNVPRMRSIKKQKIVGNIYLDIMEQVFIVTILITLLFCLTRFVERRYLNDDAKPLKETVRDALVVMVCSITGAFLYFQFSGIISDFFNVVTETKVLNPSTTQVFTDSPAF